MTPDKEIAKVLRKLEYGVYVVTMGQGNDGNAFTASWISQVSSDPPMIVLAVHNKHQSSRLLQQRPAFVVNLIPATDAEVAKTYYGPAESGYQKLKDSRVTNSPATGSPIIAGAAGYLDCKVVKQVPAGNHTLFIAEIRAAQSDGDRPVLTTSTSNLHYMG